MNYPNFYGANRIHAGLTKVSIYVNKDYFIFIYTRGHDYSFQLNNLFECTHLIQINNDLNNLYVDKYSNFTKRHTCQKKFIQL